MLYNPGIQNPFLMKQYSFCLIIIIYLKKEVIELKQKNNLSSHHGYKILSKTI